MTITAGAGERGGTEWYVSGGAVAGARAPELPRAKEGKSTLIFAGASQLRTSFLNGGETRMGGIVVLMN